MTIKGQVKILDNKIRQNKADFDLYRQNAKISALSSVDLNKYEYLSGEDLEYRPDPVQKAKFEYSSLGEVFNRGLNPNEKQEGLLKRLKNIEDKTDYQSLENKDSQFGIKSVVYMVNEGLSQKAKNMIKELASPEKLIDYQNLYLKGQNNAKYLKN